MLLISEVLRVVAQTCGYAVSQRKIGLLVVVLVVGIIVAATATATVVAPVAIYPFL